MPRIEATDPQRRGGSVHHAGIEFDYALFIRQAAVSDGAVFRIEFVDIDTGDNGIERIAAGLKNLHGAGAGSQPILAGDDNLARMRLGLSRGGSQHGGPRKHGTAGQVVRHMQDHRTTSVVEAD